MSPEEFREYDFKNPHREKLIDYLNKERKKLKSDTPRCLRPNILEELLAIFI
tara:strand:- start:1023 stop:1178 length:156 start_codon:yes stop_codon:yes gene_type:complete